MSKTFYPEEVIAVSHDSGITGQSFLLSGAGHCSHRGPDGHPGRSGHSGGRSQLVVLCGEKEEAD